MTPKQIVPFLDLKIPHVELEEELVRVLRGALQSAGFIGGPLVDRFEAEFAEFCSTKYCVGVGSGTDALRFALMAAGVKQGDIVLTVSNTFIATAEAISQAGGVPQFIDIDEVTYNIDPAGLREYMERQCTFSERRAVHRETGRVVRAVVPVHLFGQTADMDAIAEIAEQFGLLVIEDACQAHGAQYYSAKDAQWKPAGSMGVAAAFSFYPGKNLGACGEAGAVTTNDEGVARKIRMLRDHGQAQKYFHDLEGYNGRLDAIQAGFLRAKLPLLDSWNAKRREAAENYRHLLSGIPDLTVPFEPSWTRPVYHLYVVRVPERDSLRTQLEANGIGTGIHYPVPLHLQKAYKALGMREGDLPVTERVSATILSLPMYPQLAYEQQKLVAEAIKRSLAPKAIHATASVA
ncbi:MAG TPA: DegT/DnrJ/EryC1/StrS family aminotransferase [Terriglobales bacterium]